MNPSDLGALAPYAEQLGPALIAGAMVKALRSLAGFGADHHDKPMTRRFTVLIVFMLSAICVVALDAATGALNWSLVPLQTIATGLMAMGGHSGTRAARGK